MDVSPFLIQIKVHVKKVRRDFGAPVKFEDRNVADAKDGYMECTSYEDQLFDVSKMELEKGIQVRGRLFVFHTLLCSKQK